MRPLGRRRACSLVLWANSGAALLPSCRRLLQRIEELALQLPRVRVLAAQLVGLPRISERVGVVIGDCGGECDSAGFVVAEKLAEDPALLLLPEKKRAQRSMLEYRHRCSLANDEGAPGAGINIVEAVRSQKTYMIQGIFGGTNGSSESGTKVQRTVARSVPLLVKVRPLVQSSHSCRSDTSTAGRTTSALLMRPARNSFTPGDVASVAKVFGLQKCVLDDATKRKIESSTASQI